jgi:hypothetical protein
MTKTRLSLTAALLIVLSAPVPSVARAQRMAGGGMRASARMSGSMARPMARAGMATARPPMVRMATRPVNSGAFFGSSSFRPGSLGNRNLGFGRPVRFRRPPVGWSGFYLLDGGYYGYYPSEDSPASDSTAYADQQDQPTVTQQAPLEQAAPVTPQEALPPLPDVGQFTLVLHSGAKIEAVGFTRAGDKIVYITVDGSRRTMAAADLDTTATQRVNEERGTPLQLSL